MKYYHYSTPGWIFKHENPKSNQAYLIMLHGDTKHNFYGHVTRNTKMYPLVTLSTLLNEKGIKYTDYNISVIKEILIEECNRL